MRRFCNASAIKASIVLYVIFGLLSNLIELICGQLFMTLRSFCSAMNIKRSKESIRRVFNYESFDNEFKALSVISLLSNIISKCLSMSSKIPFITGFCSFKFINSLSSLSDSQLISLISSSAKSRFKSK